MKNITPMTILTKKELKQLATLLSRGASDWQYDGKEDAVEIAKNLCSKIRGAQK